MRRFKWTLGITGLLALTVLIAAVVILSTYDFNRLKPTIQRSIRKATGQTVDIVGDINLRISLMPTLVVRDVRLGNASWSSRPQALAVRRIRLQMALKPLLDGNIRVRDLTLVEPEVHIERSSAGEWNIQLPAGEQTGSEEERDSTSSENAIFKALAFHQVQVENGRFTYTDHRTGADVRIQVDSFFASAESVFDPIVFAVVGRFRGLPCEARGSFGSLSGLIGQEQSVPVTLNGKVADVDVAVAGTVEDLLDLSGLELRIRAGGPGSSSATRFLGLDRFGELGPFDLDFALRDAGDRFVMEQLNAALGSPEGFRLTATGLINNLGDFTDYDLTVEIAADDATGLEPLLGRPVPLTGPLRFSGRCTDPEADLYRFEDFRLALYGLVLDGSVDVNLGEKTPRFRGSVGSGTVDLRPLLKERRPAGTHPRSEKKGEKVFSDRPLPFELLRGADLDVTLKVGKLLLDRVVFTRLNTHVRLAGGRFTLEGLRSGIGGGQLEGHLDVRAEGKWPTVTATVAVDNLNLERMLKDLEVNHTLEGEVDLELAAVGSGRSVAGLLGGLNGKVVVMMDKGRIDNEYLKVLGSDLASGMLRLLNPFRGKSTATEINCLISRFDIEDGLAESRALVMDTKDSTVFGEGKINLQTEELDMSFKPAVKRGIGIAGIGKISLSLGELTRPLKLTGTLSEPNMSVDPAQTAVMVGKAVGGFTLFGPIGIAAVLANGSFGGKNPCLEAIEAAETKAPAQPEHPDRQERFREHMADDVGGNFHWMGRN